MVHVVDFARISESGDRVQYATRQNENGRESGDGPILRGLGINGRLTMPARQKLPPFRPRATFH
jgi:hypothetical protein